jgi:lysophospholipid acyltransferase (LPLAT)-like uncharacterized protein
MADSDAKPPPARSPTSGVVVPARLKWNQRLAAASIFGLARLLMGSWRVTFRDETGFLADPTHGPVIFALWHNRLALSMTCWLGYVRPHRPHAKLVAMISASKDGGLLANILGRFRVVPVRGSSSRRGRQALLESARLIGRGHDIAITPDGPRGPAFRVQPGVLALAQLSGRPIVPTSVKIGWKTELKSWDRFQIPWPGAKCEVVFREAIQVPRAATVEDRERLAVDLAKAMDRPCNA